MNQAIIDRVVYGIAIFSVLILIGMLTGIWELIFYSIPILTIIYIFLASLNKKNHIGPMLKWIIIFGVINTALYFWAGFGLEDQGNSFWGLSKGTGVLVYIIWPFSTIFYGLFFAFIYSNWLSKDIKKLDSTKG